MRHAAFGLNVVDKDIAYIYRTCPSLGNVRCNPSPVVPRPGMRVMFGLRPRQTIIKTLFS